MARQENMHDLSLMKKQHIQLLKNQRIFKKCEKIIGFFEKNR